MFRRPDGRPAHALSSFLAAYDVQGSLDAWVRTLTARCSSLAPEQYGAVTRVVDALRGDLVGSYEVAVRDERVRDLFLAHQRRSAHRLDFLLETQGGAGTRGFVTRAVRVDTYLREMHQRFESGGVHNMLHLTAHQLGRWVTVGLATSRPLSSPWSLRAWHRAKQHFETGLRLQTASDALVHAFATSEPARGAAVPGAGPVHLRRLARAAVEARSSPLESAALARQVWLGLLWGTWSVVDGHDHDDRRYILAVPGSSASRDPRALSARERQVTALTVEGRGGKSVARALGISPSTVTSTLGNAVAKLDLQHRALLTTVFTLTDLTREERHTLGVEPTPAASPRAARPVRALLPSRGLRARRLPTDVVALSFDLRFTSSRSSSLVLDLLTPAQRRVASAALDGLGDVEIARELGLSHHTVSNHLRRAYARVGVTSRSELGALVRDGDT